MKKQIFLVLVITIMASIPLTACGHEHEYGEWMISKPATCTEDGIEERTCIDCNATETRAISATGHSFEEWNIVTEATCIEDGLQEHSCLVCGVTETETIPATGHNFEEWVEVVPVTCDTNGKQEHTCTICGITENEEIVATGHNFTKATLVKPKTCSVCGATEGEALSTVLGKGTTAGCDNHELTVSDIYFTSSLKEKAGHITYSYQDGHYLVIKLSLTNLATENFERWSSNRITDNTLTYAGKYNYEGDLWIAADDIVPLQTRNAYIVYEVPTSMDDDGASEIIATFTIDNTKYAVLVQEGTEDNEVAENSDSEVNIETAINVGDTRTNGESFEFTLSKVMATSSLKEKAGNVTYSYQDGHYLVLQLSFTNLSTETLERWSTDRATSMVLTYDDKYTYEGDFDVLTDDIVPLQTRNAYICYEIPETIDSDEKNLIATFTIDGCEFSVDCRANMQ